MSNEPFSNTQIMTWLFDTLEGVANGSYVYVCDLRTDYSKWSKAAVDTFALPSDVVYKVYELWETIVHPDDRALFVRTNAAVIAGDINIHDMSYRVKTRDGSYVMLESKGYVLKDSDSTPLFFCGLITNHGIHSNVDPDTGLRNLYGFFEDLNGMIQAGQPFRAFMFGVNHFSEINELYGYSFGNRVFQEIAKVLLEAAGTFGTIYRMDGARFAYLTTIASTERLERGHAQLVERFKAGLMVDGILVSLTFSAGMIPVETTTDLNGKLIYTCLRAVYNQSKMHGDSGLSVFNANKHFDISLRLRKLNAIRNSILNDCEGFFLCYQPIMNCVDEKLHGAEALLRWKSPEFGTVYPDEFIEIIERDPLYDILGNWILRQAMTDGHEFVQHSPSFVMNINLSYSQMEKKGFADDVLRIMEECQYEPQNLCLEITERCRLGDINLLKSIISVLRSRGIRFALDDFGTGFSSLGVLKEIQMDSVKIDRQFTKDMLHDRQSQHLIEQTAALAAVFGSDICAEGIETKEMRDLLTNFNVGTIQGYYYSKPVEKDVFTAHFWGKTEAVKE